MTCGSEEPNAIVQVGNGTIRTEPNVRATEQEIYEGLEASSQNCWPSVEFDIGWNKQFSLHLFQQDFIIKHLCGLLVSGRNMNFQLDVSWFRQIPNIMIQNYMIIAIYIVMF